MLNILKRRSKVCKRIAKSIILFLAVLVIFVTVQEETYAQSDFTRSSSLFQVTGGLTRIAIPGELADTVSVWGEVRRAGRYLLPKGTTVAQMLSYASGPINYRSNETMIDWSDVRIEITISSYNSQTKISERQFFSFVYRDEFPVELRELRIRNEDIITVEIKRKPVLRDYINVIAPSLSLVFSFWALYDRINR